MKKRILFILLLLFSFHFSYSQNPLVKQWDKRFGGNDIDELSCFFQTSDGGYILGGSSYSDMNGDKTQALKGNEDYWVVKIDSLGNKEWDKDFGGTDEDVLYSIKQTTDGGYILGGASYSGIGGDKTQAKWGSYDYWIIKIDSLGNKQWDKDFGGIGDNHLYSLQQTEDGGYILGGYSSASISGDKTQVNWDLSRTTSDYWIIKIDSLGKKEWDKAFGGTADDQLLSLQQTTDGGYILGGWSNSGISGNKNQATQGNSDYWIVKIDSIGNMQWDRDFGGSSYEAIYSLKQTTDGGYILGGTSYSGKSADKSEANWDLTNSTTDYWIIKIDSIGNKQWDKDDGGNDNEDMIGNIIQTPDGGYLISGSSNSSMSGNKTENNLGVEQTWIVKIDSLGHTEWDKTLFTTGEDEGGYALRAKDGCYVFSNISYSGIGGYKTQITQGTYDYWIIKFCDSTLSTQSLPFVHSEDSQIETYPNPVEGSFVINHLPSGISEVRIYNILGSLILGIQSEISNQQSEIDVATLAKGVYIVEVSSGEKVYRAKFVKQ